jgi:hypothetical protein
MARSLGLVFEVEEGFKQFCDTSGIPHRDRQSRAVLVDTYEACVVRKPHLLRTLAEPSKRRRLSEDGDFLMMGQ